MLFQSLGWRNSSSLEEALLVQEGRSSRAGQKHCSERAHCQLSQIPCVRAGHTAKPQISRAGGHRVEEG